MKKEKATATELVVILDRSGSMVNLTDDTIGGYNSFIEEQKKVPGRATLTTVLFDDLYEVLHDGVDLATVKPITNKEYFARGSTALLDAMGKAINTVNSRIQLYSEGNKPNKVIVMVTTDGFENSSQEFTKESLKQLVDRKTNDDGWEFIFIGANIDSFDVAKSIGISMAANYTPTPDGVTSVYAAMSNTTSDIRSGRKVSDTWSEEIR